MTMLLRGFVALAVLGSIAPMAWAESYSLNGDNTKIEFVGTKKDGSHSGSFPKLTGTAKATGSDATTLSVNVVIDVDAMKTDADKLTAHLKSPDFFEVKRYPEAKFVSTGVKRGKSGYTVDGNLTMHGQTKKVSFPADITLAPEGLKLAGKFKIDRNDWGITYGKGMIDDAVSLKIDVAAKK